ncbi:hypothetical protein Tco_1276214 [Tanacetum coccineum]
MLMVDDNVRNPFRQNVVQNVGHLVGQGIQNVGNRNRLSVVLKIANQYGNGNVETAPAKGNGNGINEEEAGIQSTQEEFKFMAAADAYAETKRVKVNCTAEDTLQQASTFRTQSDNAPIYNSDGSTEMKNVISAVSSVEQGGGTVEQHPANVEETRVLYDSLYNNLAIETEKVNLVNRKLRETNAELTIEFARYKNQEKCKQITALNEEISKLNKQLSKEKSTISSFQEEKKRLKSDFKIREDELLDKQIQLKNKIKELDNIFEAAKFVQDFQSLAKEANESLAKYKALELEIERLLRVVVSQDIMSIMQNNSVIDTSNLQTELEQCKYDKISYEKAYNDMQQKIEQLQAQLGDPKGKSKDTPCVSDTLDPLPQKLENENVE